MTSTSKSKGFESRSLRERKDKNMVPVIKVYDEAPKKIPMNGYTLFKWLLPKSHWW